MVAAVCLHRLAAPPAVDGLGNHLSIGRQADIWVYWLLYASSDSAHDHDNVTHTEPHVGHGDDAAW